MASAEVHIMEANKPFVPPPESASATRVRGQYDALPRIRSARVGQTKTRQELLEEALCEKDSHYSIVMEYERQQSSVLEAEKAIFEEVEVTFCTQALRDILLAGPPDVYSVRPIATLYVVIVCPPKTVGNYNTQAYLTLHNACENRERVQHYQAVDDELQHFGSGTQPGYLLAHIIPVAHVSGIRPNMQPVTDTRNTS
eukprot:5827779-Pyramimonas_sp.AAC.1